jgi:HEAT repeat protein
MPLIRKPPAASASPSIDGGRLRNGSEDERWSSAHAMNAAEHVPVLRDALAVEGNPRVREAILTSLCRIATVESAVVIVPYVASDDAGVRRAALDALCSMPLAAAPHLEAMLSDEDADVRLLACEVARVLPADLATPLLLRVLERDGVANVCTAAIDVLTEMAGHEALDALRAAAARFPDDTFLQFGVEAAIERINASAP